MSIETILRTLDLEIARLEATRKLLSGDARLGNTGAAQKQTRHERNPPAKRRTLSAAARRKIAAGQRKRWAAVRKGKASSGDAKK
jgi:hypothetical protein